MSKYIVVSGNRILDYGEKNDFISMGGTVVRPGMQRTYQNATVVNVDALPCDIDTVGYEYHAGNFVPCAPYGMGYGTVAVLCSQNCKSIKDSGIPLSSFGRVVELTYDGNGKTYYSSGDNDRYRSSACSLTFDAVPKMLIITKSAKNSEDASRNMAIITPYGGMAIDVDVDLNAEIRPLYTGNIGTRANINEPWVYDEKTIYWGAKEATYQMNESGVTYHVTAILSGDSDVPHIGTM